MRKKNVKSSFRPPSRNLFKTDEIAGQAGNDSA